MQQTISLDGCLSVFGASAAVKERLGFRSRLVLSKLGYEVGQRLADTLQAALPVSWVSLAEEVAVRAEYPHTLQLRADEYEVLDAPPPVQASAEWLRDAPAVPLGLLKAPVSAASNVRMAIVQAYFGGSGARPTRLAAAKAYHRLSAGC